MAIKKTELYSSLWASANELRGGMDASEYKDLGVYEWQEVENFIEKYFAGVDASELSPILQTNQNIK